MALKIETTIRNTDDISADYIMAHNIVVDHFYILQGLEEDQLPVEVLCRNTHDSFAIKTPSGTIIDNVPYMWLDGFNEDGPVWAFNKMGI